jgi:hypothetical protein
MSESSRYPEEKLLYRRQFVMGPKYADCFPSWTHVEIRRDILVTAHPELSVARVADGKRSVTLLGFILDPGNPEATNEDILEALLQKIRDDPSRPPFEHTSRLGGRWVLVIDDGSRVRLFHDAMGLREVHWTDRETTGTVWVASQPAPLTEFLPLKRDPRAESLYINSSEYKEWPEYVWPGDTSAFSGVRRLLPNHALDLLGGRVERYWPDRPLGRLSLKEGADRASRLMARLVSAAARRFPLALATTSGWDTRLVLSASRSIAGSLYFFTRNRVENRADVTTAPRLVRRLGFEPHLISFPQEMSAEFGAIYRRNVTEAHAFWGRMAEGMYQSWPQGYVSVTGNAAEILRVRLRLGPGESADGPALARLMALPIRLQDRMEKNPFVVEAWSRWLEGVGDLHGYELLDLFYWESYSGSFAATGQTEYDIVQEAFTPYDCRELLMTMLSVDERYRDHDRPELYVAMIRRLWPEVLREPVNQAYEGPWTPVLRVLRSLGMNRLVPAGGRRLARRAIGLGAK